MQIGYKLATEGFAPTEIIRQAVAAEEAGFDFVELSDHYHPWLEEQGHSGFTWSMLGAIAARTTSVGLVTGVTCPTMRYHPAIIAQAAATMALISDGRFTLGVGSGENLNEHIIGAGWPVVSRRHEMLREALEIIRLLWSGGYHSYKGQYLQLEDARVWDLPTELPEIAVALSGEASIAVAAELGDGMFAVEPRAELVDGFREQGGAGSVYGEVPLAYAATEEEALAPLREKERWALAGWKVMAELPNPVNFDAASQTVRDDDLLEAFACGPDVEKHAAAVGSFVDAGFDHLVLHNSGPDPDAFFEFFATELRSRITE
ncbi:TIGR03557 family F420-dependent LLM class oxidoreductase [Salinibacterium soli]|uniref:TIGR03557 family F420-dependent LLM class oxidoreductase n=1 Tax=Antiquaquibacter soli TaxID=3064523 RepID=A0ABT9BQ20_9MICO|nr:TIGR03557 family F420-dependent LLM class oxidoreductase [Protaetiibacter sp. WY-16]MDO7883125.1 TIGR03557 family F420-dependent LLM class oxidoreductase [Protaetiibacter sp. WY-16]